MTIGLNPFFKEQLLAGKFEDVKPKGNVELIDLIEANWDKQVPGYRDGVIRVPIPHAGWKTTIVTLVPGMKMVGSMESRVKGETPRKQTRVWVDELPEAKLVEVVLYHKDVLAEGDEPRTEHEWQVITILTHPTEVPTPMAVGTLMANHFGADGGTATNMTPLQFETALRESYFYWKDKGHACQAKKVTGGHN
jgi:hypothetical protein